MPREFAILQQYFRDLGPKNRRVQVDAGDDCAVLRLTGEDLAISTDTLVSGVHFPHKSDGALVAHRAFASCTSDLAAMGASPFAFLGALTLPQADDIWLQAFAERLASLADAEGMRLIGGDLTEGPLTVSLQVLGTLPPGRKLLRSGAGLDDLLCVTGSLGNARAGLELLRSGAPGPAPLLQAYAAPKARTSAGEALLAYATAAVDISDGLLADASHLARASALGLEIDLARLPLDPALRTAFPAEALDFALTGGDDYELCFTLPEERLAACQRALAAKGAEISHIGRMTSGDKLSLLNPPPGFQQPDVSGYIHF